MTKAEDLKIKALIHTIGLNNNLTDNEVKEIIESQFRFTYQEIRKLRFDNLTNEEIDNLKKTFYFKYIGKIYTNSEIINSYKRKENYVKQLKDGRQNEFE